jgi:hypothetical protein
MSGGIEAAMRPWERELSTVPDKKDCWSHIDDYTVSLLIKRESNKCKFGYRGKIKLLVDLEERMNFLTDALIHSTLTKADISTGFWEFLGTVKRRLVRLENF